MICGDFLIIKYNKYFYYINTLLWAKTKWKCGLQMITASIIHLKQALIQFQMHFNLIKICKWINLLGMKRGLLQYALAARNMQTTTKGQY